MKGYVITFFTQQDRRHHGQLLGEWLVNLAREMGLPGATLIVGSMGYGHHRRIHSSHFFELADQPQEIQMAVSEEDADRLFQRLEAEGVHVFYVRTPVEYGSLGGEES
ncbi:MAG: DUF190 domain-containing protein [Magnetococcales bacterium]|nr:DUF190 domain-containing protein [Magnetococcales bacterium]